MNTCPIPALSTRMFGIENSGKLLSVIVHTPKSDLSFRDDGDSDEINPFSFHFIEEHKELCSLLSHFGIEVIQLRSIIDLNQDIINDLPELTHVGGTAVLCASGAFLSRMFLPARKFEEFIIREAIQALSIPIAHEFYSNDDYFEGFIPFDNKTLIITNTKHHEADSVVKFIQNALIFFDEVIRIETSKAERFYGADSVFNKIRNDCVMIFPQAIIQSTVYRRYYSCAVDILNYFEKRNVECVTISDTEQLRHACSFISVNNNTLIHFENTFEDRTQLVLQKKRIEHIPIHSVYLRKKSGALSSYMLPIYRG